MTVPFKGGCACGAVRYECTSEPQLAFNCHCRDCQRISGAPFITAILVPEDALTINGNTHGHTQDGDSGGSLTRYFCSDCGSALFAKVEAFPGVLGIKVMSMDDPSWISPSMDFYTKSAHPWVTFSDITEKFDGMPS